MKSGRPFSVGGSFRSSILRFEGKRFVKGVYSDSQCGVRKVDVNYIDFPCPSPVSKLA